MSMSIADGNWDIWDICKTVEILENNIFTNSLIGATMQDSGTRERSNVWLTSSL